jgi:hypothetical protein
MSQKPSPPLSSGTDPDELLRALNRATGADAAPKGDKSQQGESSLANTHQGARTVEDPASDALPATANARAQQGGASAANATPQSHGDDQTATAARDPSGL